MPRTWIKRDWAAGQQSVSELANRYDVSERAMARRLKELRIGYEPAATENAEKGGRTG